MEKKVLIVEDEVLVGMMLARKIRQRGFVVCEVVCTGAEAIAAAARIGWGTVLMDVSLSGEMDGIEAARQIREQFGLPIVFFTGYSRDRELLQRAKVVQPTAILNKLGTMEEIVTALDASLAPEK